MQALGGAAAELSLASVTRDAEASGEGTQARSEPPNVLFVAFDDLNHWAEPLGGHPQTRTPHLKRFAENGINFANSYCASPSCLPSRTALMSGLYPHHNGVYTNYQHWREAFPPEAEMLPHYLMSQGYYSAGSGKVFHDANPTSWNDYFPSKEQPVVENFRPKPGQLVNMPAFPGVYTDFETVEQPVEREPARRPGQPRFVYRRRGFTDYRVGKGGPELTFETLKGDVQVKRAAR